MEPKKSLTLGKPLPSVAPELWRGSRRSEFRNPAHFILRYYGPYLSEAGNVLGMRRVDLKPLDPALYIALRNWLRNELNKKSGDWRALKNRLPTLAERNNEIMNALLEGRGVPGLTIESLLAVMQAAERRRKNSKEPDLSK